MAPLALQEHHQHHGSAKVHPVAPGSGRLYPNYEQCSTSRTVGTSMVKLCKQAGRWVYGSEIIPRTAAKYNDLFPSFESWDFIKFEFQTSILCILTLTGITVCYDMFSDHQLCNVVFLFCSVA